MRLPVSLGIPRSRDDIERADLIAAALEPCLGSDHCAFRLRFDGNEFHS